MGHIQRKRICTRIDRTREKKENENVLTGQEGIDHDRYSLERKGEMARDCWKVG